MYPHHSRPKRSCSRRVSDVDESFEALCHWFGRVLNLDLAQGNPHVSVVKIWLTITEARLGQNPVERSDAQRQCSRGAPPAPRQLTKFQRRMKPEELCCVQKIWKCDFTPVQNQMPMQLVCTQVLASPHRCGSPAFHNWYLKKVCTAWRDSIKSLGGTLHRCTSFSVS